MLQAKTSLPQTQLFAASSLSQETESTGRNGLISPGLRALQGGHLAGAQRRALVQQAGQQYGNRQVQRIIGALKPRPVAPTTVQRNCGCAEAANEAEKCSSCRAKSQGQGEENPVQRSPLALPFQTEGTLQRTIQVETPGDPLPGNPPKQHWEEIRDMTSQICPTFTVTSSGAMTPTGDCSTPQSRVGCQHLCDLHSAPDEWKVKIDENSWPATYFGEKRVRIHSTRTAWEFGAWGGGAQRGQRVMLDAARVLAHELCGHAWENLRHLNRPLTPQDGGRPNHDSTVAIENQIAQEMSGTGFQQRGSFADPHHGESFARMTLSHYPMNRIYVGDLPPEMQERVRIILNFMLRRENRAMKLDIMGHADRTGNLAANEQVSSLRANMMKTHLINHGITPNRILVTSGKNFTECPAGPTADNPECRKVEVYMFGYAAASEGHA